MQSDMQNEVNDIRKEGKEKKKEVKRQLKILHEHKINQVLDRDMLIKCCLIGDNELTEKEKLYYTKHWLDPDRQKLLQEINKKEYLLK